MPPLTRQQFVEHVLQIVRERFPLVKVARSEMHSFSLRINGQVAPLENLYRLIKLNPQDMRRHIERWMVELLRASEGVPDRDAGFEAVRERILPMVINSRSSEVAVDTMVTQPFLEDLLIAYAIDHDRTIAYLSRKQYALWKVDIDDLHQVAIDNLVTRSESIQAHAAQDEDGSVNLVLFQTMDGYDASRILLPTLHDRLRDHLGSPFAAGIPNRDILICFRDDRDLLNRVGPQIAADYRSMPHQVSDRLLLVTADGIAPYPD